MVKGFPCLLLYFVFFCLFVCLIPPSTFCHESFGIPAFLTKNAPTHTPASILQFVRYQVMVPVPFLIASGLLDMAGHFDA